MESLAECSDHVELNHVAVCHLSIEMAELSPVLHVPKRAKRDVWKFASAVENVIDYTDVCMHSRLDVPTLCTVLPTFQPLPGTILKATKHPRPVPAWYVTLYDGYKHHFL